MSAIVETGSGGRGGQSQDFELNLASVIDCFTVLITFMLASASFLSIGILDAGIAAAGAVATNTPPPAINITVEIGKENGLTVKTVGKSTTTNELKAKAGTYDYDTLTSTLSTIKAKFPDVSAVTLVAGDLVPYNDVVKAMEVTKQTLPVVVLGGF